MGWLRAALEASGPCSPAPVHCSRWWFPGVSLPLPARLALFASCDLRVWAEGGWELKWLPPLVELPGDSSILVAVRRAGAVAAGPARISGASVRSAGSRRPCSLCRSLPEIAGRGRQVGFKRRRIAQNGTRHEPRGAGSWGPLGAG